LGRSATAKKKNFNQRSTGFKTSIAGHVMMNPTLQYTWIVTLTADQI